MSTVDSPLSVDVVEQLVRDNLDLPPAKALPGAFAYVKPLREAMLEKWCVNDTGRLPQLIESLFQVALVVFFKIPFQGFTGG